MKKVLNNQGEDSGSKINNGEKLYYLCPVRTGRSSTSVLSDTPQNSAAVAAYCGGKVAIVSEGCKGSLAKDCQM